MAIEYTINDKNKRIKCVDFNGFLDQLEYIKSFIQSNTFNTATEVDKKDNFYGKHSLNDTLEGMNYGFKYDTEYMLNILQDNKNYRDDSSGIYMDYEGFAYDMGSVVTGVPECCLNSGLPTPTPYIKILVDLVFSAFISSKNILNRGIAITALINTLLSSKYIVELYLVDFNVQYDMNVMYTNKIDTQILCISNVAFMCSPEYFRKIGFITTDKIRGKQSQMNRGSSEILKFMLDKIKREKIFYIGGDFTDKNIDKNLDTPQSAIKYITDNFNLYCKENKLNIMIKGY